MKKRFLVAAMAATMISPLAAQADVSVYGIAHLGVQNVDTDGSSTDGNLDVFSGTSALGFKGKEDLGGGMTAFFKVETDVNMDDSANASSSLNLRNAFVGLKTGMGSLKLGTVTTNYKSTGAKVDPLWRTPVEGRGMINTQSSTYQGGKADDRGRMTNAIKLASSKMGGMQMVFNYGAGGADTNAMGIGVHYKAKGVTAFVDYFDRDNAAGDNAMKVGGAYKMGTMTFSGQFEATDNDASTANDFIHLNGTFGLSDTGAVSVTFGQESDVSSGAAVAYVHTMSKRTSAYAGYGTVSEDSTGSFVTTSGADKSGNAIAVGLRHKF